MFAWNLNMLQNDQCPKPKRQQSFWLTNRIKKRKTLSPYEPELVEFCPSWGEVRGAAGLHSVGTYSVEWSSINMAISRSRLDPKAWTRNRHIDDDAYKHAWMVQHRKMGATNKPRVRYKDSSGNSHGVLLLWERVSQCKWLSIFLTIFWKLQWIRAHAVDVEVSA